MRAARQALSRTNPPTQRLVQRPTRTTTLPDTLQRTDRFIAYRCGFCSSALLYSHRDEDKLYSPMVSRPRVKAKRVQVFSLSFT